MNWTTVFSLAQGKIIGNWNHINPMDPIIFRIHGDFFIKNSVFLVKHNAIPFVNQSLDKGVTVVVSEEIFPTASPMYLVNNLNEFINKIVNYNLNKVHIKIGITGSAGKTTTTRNLADYLNTKYQDKWSCLSTNFRNYNTPLGISTNLMALELESYDDDNSSIANPITKKNNQKLYNCCVYELGISQPGDMKLLTNIFSPNIVICLPINYSHSSNFKNLEQLINEKLSIVNPDTTIFIGPEEYKSQVMAINNKLNFINLESLYPNQWQLDGWNNNEIYTLFIENIGNKIIELLEQN